jgi:hypothetical protein
VDPFNFEGMISLYNLLDTLIFNELRSLNGTPKFNKNASTFMSKINTLYIRIESKEKNNIDSKQHFSHFMHDLVQYSAKLQEFEESKIQTDGYEKKWDCEKKDDCEEIDEPDNDKTDYSVRKYNTFNDNSDIKKCLDPIDYEMRSNQLYKEIRDEIENSKSLNNLCSFYDSPNVIIIGDLIIYCFAGDDEELNTDDLCINYQIILDNPKDIKYIGKCVFLFKKNINETFDIFEICDDIYIHNVFNVDHLKPLKEKMTSVRAFKDNNYSHFSEFILKLNTPFSVYTHEVLQYVFRIAPYVFKVQEN